MLQIEIFLHRPVWFKIHRKSLHMMLTIFGVISANKSSHNSIENGQCFNVIRAREQYMPLQVHQLPMP